MAQDETSTRALTRLILAKAILLSLIPAIAVAQSPAYVPMQRGRHGRARAVHPGEGLEQADLERALVRARQPAAAEAPLEALLVERDARALGEALDHPEAHVVARGGVARPRVAETHDELHGGPGR